MRVRILPGAPTNFTSGNANSARLACKANLSRCDSWPSTPTQMKTEEEILAIMKHFKCSRTEAVAAPDFVVQFLGEQVPLTKAEIAYGRKVARRFLKEQKS
jgi:hypothetical protein